MKTHRHGNHVALVLRGLLEIGCHLVAVASEHLELGPHHIFAPKDHDPEPRDSVGFCDKIAVDSVPVNVRETLYTTWTTAITDAAKDKGSIVKNRFQAGVTLQ